MLRVLSDSEAQRYMNAWPDVKAAFLSNPMGMTMTQFATAHYNKFGIAEMRGLDGKAKPTDAPVGTIVNTNTVPGTNVVIVPYTTDTLPGQNNMILWLGVAAVALLLLMKKH